MPGARTAGAGHRTIRWHLIRINDAEAVPP